VSAGSVSGGWLPCPVLPESEEYSESDCLMPVTLHKADRVLRPGLGSRYVLGVAVCW